MMMRGHTWEKHFQPQGEKRALVSDQPKGPYRSVALVILVTFLLFRSSCSFFTSPPNLTRLAIKTDKVRLPKGGSLREVADLFGVPPSVLAAVNTIDADSYVPQGTLLAVPFYNELFPVWRHAETNRLATKNSLKHYLRISPKRNLPDKVQLMWPVPGAEPGSSFGMRKGRFHHGVDIPAPRGSPIFAAHRGQVTFAGWQNGYGLMVKVAGGELGSRYAHASRVLVEVGEYVEQGQLIAQVGATGNATGPHLHYEVRILTPDDRSASIDPLLFHTSRWLLAQNLNFSEN